MENARAAPIAIRKILGREPERLALVERRQGLGGKLNSSRRMLWDYGEFDMKIRSKFKVCLATGFILIAVIEGISWIVPCGASPLPWLVGRAPETVKIDENLTAYFNDAGAAHSGNHWCWIVRSKLLTRTVAEGYQTAEVLFRGNAAGHQIQGRRQVRSCFLREPLR